MDGIPGGQRRTGQCGCLQIGVRRGNFDDTLFRQTHELRHGAVDRPPQRLRQSLKIRFAGNPVLEVSRTDTVAHCDPPHALTDFDDNAHPVRDRNQWQVSRVISIATIWNDKVTVVQ